MATGTASNSFGPDYFRDHSEIAFKLIDALPANICILNWKANIVAVNKSWLAFSVSNGGHPEATGIGTNYLKVCEKAAEAGDVTATAVAEALTRIINGQPESHKIEYPCHSPDAERWFLLNLTSYTLEDKLYIVAAHFDITERYLSHQKMKEAESLYRSVFAVLNDGLVVQDHNDKIITANDAAARILKLSMNQLLALDSYDPRWRATNEDNLPIKPEEHPSVVTARTGREINGYIMHISVGDDERVIISINTQPIFNENGQVEKVVLSFRDITDLRLSQIHLRNSEYKFRALMEQSPVSIHIHDMDGYLMDANPAYARLFALDEKTLSSLYHTYNVLEDKQLRQIGISNLIKQLFNGDDVDIPVFEYDGNRTLEYLGIDLGNSLKRYVKTRGFTLLDEGGNKLAVVFMSEDVTELMSAVNELKISQGKLNKSLFDTVDLAMDLGERRDPYTAGHQRRVSIIAIEIAKQMGVDEKELQGLEIAAKLHDIGKIAIPSDILSTPRKLTNIEFELIKTHVVAGYDILKHIEFPWPVAEIVLQHHERMDGSGYPRGMRGDAIMPQARILAIADTIEAMTTHRPYRSGLGIEVALAEIEKNSGITYDSGAVGACLELFHHKNFSIPK